MNRKQRKRLRRKLARHQALQSRQLVPTSPDILPLESEPVIVASAKNTSNKMRLSASYAFSGPLPPPELLAKYNDVIPNGAERIMAFIGREIAGSIFVGTDLAALAGVFVYGKQTQRKELAKKNEQFERKK